MLLPREIIDREQPLPDFVLSHRFRSPAGRGEQLDEAVLRFVLVWIDLQPSARSRERAWRSS